jgi:sulfotransferase family protein
LTRLIYIGGYGHSGSTLLEYLMTGSPEVLACGEVASCIRERTRKQKICTCGRKANKCPEWSFFFSSSSQATRWTHEGLLLALTLQGSGRYSAIIDSSKTAWGSLSMPFRLRRKFGTNFILLHLVRDPTAVCWSVLKQKNLRANRKGRKLHHYSLRCSWTMLGWWLANLSCELFGMIYSCHYVRLRYEDIVHSPPETLCSLFETLLPNVRWRPGDIDFYDNRHQLHGNKTRRRIKSVEDVKEDLKWKVEMPSEYSKVVLPLSYLLRLRYGYS